MNKLNRKRILKDESFNYQGANKMTLIECEQIKINTGTNNQGVYFEIINSTIQQLDLALQIHKRILVHRFDLHPAKYTSNNEPISKFIKRIKQWIYRNYKITDIGYIWVRELEKSKQQHWHVAIFLDGNKIQHPKKLNAKIKEMYTPYGHMPVIEKPFYFIDKNDNGTRLEAIYRLSYLAKVRGKGYRDIQAKDYGTSRLQSPLIHLPSL